MTDETKTAFISYSWDDTVHQNWVVNLTNRLRRNGVVATMDLFITQSGTVNLNAMMIQNLNFNDYVIVVLTENYAVRADQFKGGVGFESILSLPLLQENPNKLIFILRHKGDYRKAFPFHLKGYHAIDFSDDNKYEEKVNDLLHRIYEVPLYEMEPLGERPTLTPKKIVSETKVNSYYADLIPKIKKEYTDMDKMRFMQHSYKEINTALQELFEEIKDQNNEFEFTMDKISGKKDIYRLFVRGQLKTGIKIWLGSSFGSSEHINLAFGNVLDHGDNSMNEIIMCTMNKDNELALTMTMNFGDRGPFNVQTVVCQIWEHHIEHFFK